MTDPLPAEWLAALAAQEDVALLIKNLRLVEGFAAFLVICPSPAIADATWNTLKTEVDRARGEHGSWGRFDPYRLPRGADDGSTADWLARQVLLPLSEEPRRVAARYRVVAVDATRAPVQDDGAWEQLFHRLNRARDTIGQRQRCPVLWMLPPRFEARFAASAPDFRAICSAVAFVDAPRPSLGPDTLTFLAEAPALLPDDFLAFVPRDGKTRHIQANDVRAPLRVGGVTLTALLQEVERSRDARRLAEVVGALLASKDHYALDELVQALESFAGRVDASGDHELALSAHRQLVLALSRLAALDREPPLVTLYDLSAAHNRVGDLLRDQTKIAEALYEYERALDLRRELVARKPDESLWRRSLVRSLRRRGDLLWKMGRVDEALAAFLESATHSRALVADLPRAGERLLELVHDLLRAAVVFLERREVSRARELGDEAFAVADRLVALDTTRAKFRHAFALTRLLRGVLEDVARHTPEAERWWRDAELELRLIAEAEPGDATVVAALAACARRRGDTATRSTAGGSGRAAVR